MRSRHDAALSAETVFPCVQRKSPSSGFFGLSLPLSHVAAHLEHASQSDIFDREVMRGVCVALCKECGGARLLVVRGQNAVTVRILRGRKGVLA